MSSSCKDSAVSEMPVRVVVATGNQGKLAEIRSALTFPGWEFVSADDLGGWDPPEETGKTFQENARIKARTAYERFGLPALADDSGLIVDALDGAPGVYSSRFGGKDATDEDNNELLLSKLAGVPLPERTARFQCTIVFFSGAPGDEVVAEGTCEGAIGLELLGGGGFGYDPLFLPDATPGKTMAELTTAEKNSISHRGAALRTLHTLLLRRLKAGI